MATSSIANLFYQHGSQIPLSMATYIISSSMSVFAASSERITFKIMSLLQSITPQRDHNV
jgi:hypothetical protein